MFTYTEKYKKMCVSCKEIQEIGNKHPSYFDEIISIDGTVFFIPMQHELQQVFKKANLPKYVNCINNDMKLDTFLRTTLSRFICCGGFNVLSFNEAWLQFYMIEVYGKRWMSSPESWVRVEK